MDEDYKENQNNSSGESNNDEEEDNYITQIDYDPNSAERIICIELRNNQQIFLEYHENWTIKDLILQILSKHEYHILNQDRNFILNSYQHFQLFDLSLCFYDSIIQPHLNRLNEFVTIDTLHELHILKNHRSPFFIMKENMTPYFYIYSGKFYKNQIKEIKLSKFNEYAMYFDYLPKMIKFVPNILNAHPELEEYFIKNKKGYNEFKPFKRNILTCDSNSVDWFIYDKESINFLIEMESKNFVENSNLRYINGNVYFEDKLNNINTNGSFEISDEELSKALVNISIDFSSPKKQNDVYQKKIKINSKTTAKNIIENICSKLSNMTGNIKLNPNKKILKVRSQNDYIFDINEPLIKFSYLNECVKLNRVAEYLIIDNPEMSIENNKNNMTHNEITEEESFMRSNTNQLFDLKKIAIHNPSLCEDNKENPNTFLEKGILNNNKNNENSTTNSLENFINSLEKEIELEISGNNPIKVNENMVKNYNESIQYNNKQRKKNTFLRINTRETDYIKYRSKYQKFSSNKPATPNIFMSSLGIKPNYNIENIIRKNNKKNKNIKNETKKIPIKNTNNKINIIKRTPLINKQIIHISKIRRPFSILFRSAYINRILNSGEGEKYTSTDLVFKFQLFSSNEPICSPKLIRWKTVTKMQNPYFNKKIYFDIHYNQLPISCSLIIKIKFKKYEKNSSKSDSIFWANYRLFDQNNRLKIGLHKINLHEREISDDIYYLYNDNPNEENSSKIFFEIENFSYPILNTSKKITENNNDITDSQLRSLGGGFLEKINKIDQKSPFDDLNNYEKMTLWRNRFAVVQMNSLIPRLFLSCDYNNPNSNLEIEQLTKMINGLSVVQAIELLSGKYVNESIRKFAVSVLKNSNTTLIQTYLLQLVQALKYEKNHDSPLARFLLEISIMNPITIGHEFFWHLRSEMFNQNVQQRFGLYLEVFLNKISKNLFKIFKEEDSLLKNLVAITEKIKTKKNKEERDRIFKEELNLLDGCLKINKKEVSLPLNFKYRIKGIISEKCKIMKSKKKPLWLTFENADNKGDKIIVMLKCGDDLRMDMVTLQLFKSMQTLWFEKGLKVKMSLYKVLCTGNQQGMLEMVTNSETLANIHVKEGGAIKQLLSKNSIKNWMDKNCIQVSPKEAIENFMLSNVAYCLATFVLGIGDRHNDNIMLKKNGELFHIDFGHFLGHFKYKMGIKRERAPFVFTKQFQSVLGGENSEMFNLFKQNLEKGYLILRNNKEVILTLLKILLCTGIPELNEKSLRFLENSLLLKKDDKDAVEFLNKKLNESIESVSTKLNFAIHIVANK